MSATSGSLDAQVDPRFGRCKYFVIVDTDTMSSEVLQNGSRNTPHGAGIQAGQTVADRGVEAVLTGNVGPNAFQVLSSAGIRIVTGVSGTVRDAVEGFKSGRLQQTTAPTSQMHFGLGGGRGMGMGRGGGRGMGMGRGGGRGMGMGWQAATSSPQEPPGGVPLPPSASPQVSKEEELLRLENYVKNLEQQLDQIRKRIEDLKAQE